MADSAGRCGKSDRCVLEGVPRVGFYDGHGAPEDDLLPSCIKAFLQFKGEDLGFRGRRGARDPWHDLHCFLLGTSGVAFRRIMSRDRWDMGDGSPFAMCEDAMEPVRRALESAGYGCEILLKPGFASSVGAEAAKAPTEAAWRARIVESIRDKGEPVIAIGVIGPPEPCLITGYDEGGAVLIGWNAFQADPHASRGVEIEPSGYFRKRRWYAGTHGLIFVGAKQPRMPVREIHRSALAFGHRLMTTPTVRGKLGGFAAFSAWADQLLDDSLFNPSAPKQLRERCEVHHQRGGDLAEARAYGANFLRYLAEETPEAFDELMAAAACFDDEHDLVWAIWEFTGGMSVSEEGVKRFGTAYHRGRLVPLVRLARTRDMDAARHIARALDQMDQADRDAAEASVPVNPNATIRRENGNVWIEGLPDLRWGAGRDCAFIGALEAVSSVTERPLRYSDMMGASGLAFRLRWSNPDTLGGWSTSSACGEYEEEWDDVQRGTGFRLEAALQAVTKEPAADPAARRVMRHIDAGWPAMADIDGPDVGLIVGYTDGGAMLARRYGEPGMREFPAKAACGGFQLFVREVGRAAPPRAVLAAALRTAVRNWRREKTSAGHAVYGDEWYYGEMALRAWADDLVLRDAAAMDENERRVFRELDRFVYASLVDARQAAVTFLRDNAPLLSGEPRAAMLRAADAYAGVVALLKPNQRAGAPRQADGESAAEWTVEERAAERELLLSALKLEEQAIAEIEKAVNPSLAAQPPAAAVTDRQQFTVLEGVPRAGYRAHLCPFPGSLCSVLQFLGDPVDYDTLMAVTGACFRRFWEKDDGGNVDLMYLGREPILRAASAIGREMRVVPHKDRGAMIDALKTTIANGRPAIAFGIIGPPEAGVVTGYDRGGRVLYGWSYFQDYSRPDYYQQTDWYERAEWRDDMGFVLIGDKFRWPGPSKRETLYAALQWAIDIAVTPRRSVARDHIAGLAAYDGWADGLENDADYETDDLRVLETRLMVHGDQCVMLEERRSAARYLRAMASEAPEAGLDLLAAADELDLVADARVWPWGMDMGVEAQRALSASAARRAIAKEVRLARDGEARAVAHLQKAVAAMEAQM